MTSLYSKHRPRKLDQVVGQPEAVEMLQGLLNGGGIPPAVLFTGGSGVGKTTLARILLRHVGCDRSHFVEINAAESRGIDTVRDIQARMPYRPLTGKSRVWLIDESHRLTPDAQSALLKILEDTPEWCRFFLATTDPQKLLKTILTRCTQIRLKDIGIPDLRELCSAVTGKENLKVGGAVLDRIAEVAEGSARKALVLLEQIAGITGEENQLNAVQKEDSRRQAIELCRTLMSNAPKWKDVAAILKGIDEDPESIRRMVLAYATTKLLNSGSPQAASVLMFFQSNYFDSGRAGLVASCWETVNSRQ